MAEAKEDLASIDPTASSDGGKDLRSAPEGKDPGFACAVCLEHYDGDERAALPCCGAARGTGSSMQFCRRCVEIICERSPGGVGKCPVCRKHLRIAPGSGEIEQCERRGVCRFCRQNRVIVDRDSCDACLLGQEHVLPYECEGCGRSQRIPHPMWRYQPTPGEFGNVTWHCHQLCNAFTQWRVDTGAVDRVPLHDCPESWGRQEEWLAQVRAQRQMERDTGRRPPTTVKLFNKELLVLVLVVVAVCFRSTLSQWGGESWR